MKLQIRALKRTFRNSPDLFELFFLAETLGKTVNELLTGRSYPISQVEILYWRKYFGIKKDLEEKAAKKKHRSSDSGGLPKMMGRGGGD